MEKTLAKTESLEISLQIFKNRNNKVLLIILLSAQTGQMIYKLYLHPFFFMILPKTTSALRDREQKHGQETFNSFNKWKLIYSLDLYFNIHIHAL